MRQQLELGVVTLVLLSTGLVAGCRTFTNPGEVSPVLVDAKGKYSIHRVSWDGTRRGTYVIRKGDEVFVVAEPPPDAVLEAATKLTAEISKAAGKDSAEATGKVQADVTETAKVLARASEVSFLRDSLYRLAEAHANGAIQASEYPKQFDMIVHRASVLLASNTPHADLALGALNTQEEAARSRAIGETDPALKQAYELRAEILREKASELASSTQALMAQTSSGPLAAVAAIVGSNGNVLLENSPSNQSGDWAATWKWQLAIEALTAQIELASRSTELKTDHLIEELDRQWNTLVHGFSKEEVANLRSSNDHPASDSPPSGNSKEARLGATKRIREIAGILSTL